MARILYRFLNSTLSRARVLHISVIAVTLMYSFTLSTVSAYYTKKLHKYLMQSNNYNKFLRPVFNESEIVSVEVGLIFRQLIDLVSTHIYTLHIIPTVTRGMVLVSTLCIMYPL